MVRAIEPYFLSPFGDPEKTILRAIEMLVAAGRLYRGAKLVVISDVLSGSNQRFESIQLRTIE